MIEILNKKTGEVMHSVTSPTLRAVILSGMNFIDADFCGMDLTNALMVGTNLSDADMRGTILIGANLANADLWRADLSGADMSRSNLNGAQFSDANLTDAVMTGARVKGTDFNGADMTRTRFQSIDFSDANLSGVKNMIRPSAAPLTCPWCDVAPEAEPGGLGRATLACHTPTCPVKPKITGQNAEQVTVDWNRRA